jgi:hypothetical protein
LGLLRVIAIVASEIGALALFASTRATVTLRSRPFLPVWMYVTQLTCA